MSNTNNTPENPEPIPVPPVGDSTGFNTLTPEAQAELNSAFSEKVIQPDLFTDSEAAKIRDLAEADGAEAAEQEEIQLANHDKYVTSGLSVNLAIEKTQNDTREEMKRQEELIKDLNGIDRPVNNNDIIAERKSEQAWNEQAWRNLGSTATTDLSPRLNK